MSTDRQAEIDAFLSSVGWGAATRTALPGDASTRRYVRLDLNGSKAMLMDQLLSAESPVASAHATPDERRMLGYNALARLAAGDVSRFIAVADYLRRRGLSAPEITAAVPAQGLALIEDLGDDLFADVIGRGSSDVELYRAAADVLAKLHEEPAPERLTSERSTFSLGNSHSVVWRLVWPRSEITTPSRVTGLEPSFDHLSCPFTW